MKIARRAGIVMTSLSAAIATMAMGSAGPVADPPGWQIATTVHYGPTGNASGYSAVVAPAQQDAWVFGGTNPGGPSSPTAERWNGRRWVASPLPAGLGSFVVAAAASSPHDVWAVGDGYALHFNGARWAVANTWSQDAEVTSVVAISRNDVWVFGAQAGFSGQAGLGAWHYDGRSWIKATGIATGIYRASGVSRRDIWAITASARGGSVARYDGRAWGLVPGADSALAGAQLDDVLAVSRDSVWISGVSPAGGTDGRLVLAHWNGARWTRFVPPWPVQQPERFAPDGAGGIWIPVVTAGDSPATWILHLSSTGAWSRTRISVGPGNGVGVGDLALIPGTATLWGTGGLLTTAGGDAAIWEHGMTGVHLAARTPGNRPAAAPAIGALRAGRPVLLGRGGQFLG